MDRKKKNLLYLFTLLAFMALNVAVLVKWMRFGGRQAEIDIDIAKAKDRVRQEWNTSESAPILSSNLGAALARIPLKNCFSDADTAYSTAPQVDERASARLMDTLERLLKAYASGDPQKVVLFMKDNGEVVPDKRMSVLIGGIEEKGIKRDRIAHMDKYEVFKLYWKKTGSVSHWQDLVYSTSCLQYVIIKDDTRLECSRMLDKQSEVWNSQTVYHRFFVPKRSPEDVMRREGRLLCADVMLVIKHDKSEFSLPAPYYFRFWYEGQADLWHLMCVQCIQSDLSKPMLISF